MDLTGVAGGEGMGSFQTVHEPRKADGTATIDKSCNENGHPPLEDGGRGREGMWCRLSVVWCRVRQSVPLGRRLRRGCRAAGWSPRATSRRRGQRNYGQHQQDDFQQPLLRFR